MKAMSISSFIVTAVKTFHGNLSAPYSMANIRQ